MFDLMLLDGVDRYWTRVNRRPAVGCQLKDSPLIRAAAGRLDRLLRLQEKPNDTDALRVRWWGWFYGSDGRDPELVFGEID